MGWFERACAWGFVGPCAACAAACGGATDPSPAPLGANTASTALLASASAAPPAPTPLSVVYSDPAGGFEARFPSTPTLDPLDWTGNVITVKGTNASIAEHGAVWLATSAVVTKADGVDCGVVVRALEENAVEGSACRAQAPNEDSSSNGVTRESAFRCDGSGMEGRVRTVCVTRGADGASFDVYQALVAFSAGANRAVDVDAFLAAFHVHPPQRASTPIAPAQPEPVSHDPSLRQGLVVRISDLPACAPFRPPPSTSPPVVRLGDDDGSERIPLAVMQRVVHSNLPAFESCYGASTKKDTCAEVAVRVVFTIDKAGAVAGASGSLPGDATLGDCVAHAVAGLAFPEPEGGSVHVELPIRFLR